MLMFDPVPIKQEAMEPVSVVRLLKYIRLCDYCIGFSPLNSYQGFSKLWTSLGKAVKLYFALKAIKFMF